MIPQHIRYYHINYGVIHGFLAVRKAEKTHVKNYRIFSCVFDIANHLLTRYSPFAPLGLMNERHSLHDSQYKVACRNFFRIKAAKTLKNPYRPLMETFKLS